jgi:hypothetical protein
LSVCGIVTSRSKLLVKNFENTASFSPKKSYCVLGFVSFLLKTSHFLPLSYVSQVAWVNSSFCNVVLWKTVAKDITKGSQCNKVFVEFFGFILLARACVAL